MGSRKKTPIRVTKPSHRDELARAWDSIGYGVLLLIEHGRKRDAFKIASVAAKSGDRHAAFQLGCCYDMAIGVARNERRALFWYRRASRHGDAAASHNIGIVYRDRNKPALARRWFRESLSQHGGEDALWELARLATTNAERRKLLGQLVLAENVSEDTHENALSLFNRTPRVGFARAVSQNGRRDVST